MAKEAVQHLIDLGHQHIGFIGGSLEYASCQNRLAGYYDALKEAGLQTSERDCVFCTRLNDEQVINLSKKLLYSPNRVTAVLAFNDLVASSVYKVAKEMGIRIPEGLSVVSFDDSLLARSLSPGLTSVSQPFYEKGYQAGVHAQADGIARRGGAEPDTAGPAGFPRILLRPAIPRVPLRIHCLKARKEKT